MKDLIYCRVLADSYESIQKIRIAAENRLRSIKQGYDEADPVREFLLERIANLKEEEASFQKEMLRELRTEPIWQEFFVYIKGIGMTLGCKLLALNLQKQKNKSSWDAYFGLTDKYWKGICGEGHQMYYAKDPLICNERMKEGDKLIPCKKPIEEKEFVGEAPRRKRGWKGFWNPRARVLYKLIADSFLKTGKFYSEMYYTFKEHEKTKGLDISDLQIHRRAQRKVVQLFLHHYYQALHEIEGTKARQPYQYEYLGHSPDSLIDWKDVVAYDSIKKKKPV